VLLEKLKVQKAELKNEQIKNQKIQEAREKFNQFKSEFETQKAKQLVEMKDREVEVLSKEGEFKAQLQSHQKDVNEFKKQLIDLEQREVELDSIRENLNKQLAIVSKRKEELDAANELRIKELERVGLLSEQEEKLKTNP
jgi:ribonucrease Y